MGIIILEGPDGGGKTTLGQHLRDVVTNAGLPCRFLHSTYRKDQWKWDTAALKLAVRTVAQGGVAILDRHWPGDNIYGQVYRQRSNLHMRRQDSVLLRYGAMLVMCCPPTEFVVAEHARLRGLRPEMYEGQLDEVSDRYLDLLHGNMLRPAAGDYVEQLSYLGGLKADRRMGVVHYDRTSVTPARLPRLARDLVESARELSLAAEQLAAPLNFNLSGNPFSAAALLVGERSAHPYGAVPWPFFSQTDASGYLTQALHKAQVPEHDVCLVNACDNDDVTFKTVERALEVGNHGQVVALGQVAANVLKNLGRFPDAVLPHPQWARRFDHHGNYHLRLKGAIYA